MRHEYRYSALDEERRQERLDRWARRLDKLWSMNPQIDPRREWENTQEGIRYWHMRARPDVYGLEQKENDHG